MRATPRVKRDGLIVREQSPTDRRAVCIKLADKGKHYQKTILACAKELNALALKGFSENEKALLNRFIERINANLS